jgi:hypothetical protein
MRRDRAGRAAQRHTARGRGPAHAARCARERAAITKQQLGGRPAAAGQGVQRCRNERTRAARRSPATRIALSSLSLRPDERLIPTHSPLPNVAVRQRTADHGGDGDFRSRAPRVLGSEISRSARLRIGRPAANHNFLPGSADLIHAAKIIRMRHGTQRPAHC